MKNEFKVARNFAKRVGAIAGGGVIALSLWVGFGGSMRASAPFVPEPITCLPTCSAVDGRSFVVAGDDNTTLAAQEISIGLNFTVASGEANGNFAFFDGDRDPANWDTPFNDGTPAADPSAPELIVELWADPTGVGGTTLLRTWTPGAVPAGIEQGPFPTANNNWSGVSFPHDAAALNGPNYIYAIHVKPANPLVDKGWNAFKVRAAGTVQLLGNQVVGFIGAMNVPNDVNIIYPSGPPTAITPNPPTTYDGTWTFQTRLPPFLGDVTVSDGDMDFGAQNCSYNDTDDPDSSGIPTFALGSAAVAEGVAVANPGTSQACSAPGVGLRTGTPADDNGNPTLPNAFRRVPTIIPNGIGYQIVAPDGQIFLNRNPSGNKEWEQFRIQKVNQASDIPGGIACPVNGFAETPGFTLPDNPNDFLYPASDCRALVLPGGVWTIQLDGMDLSNLNFWFFSFKVEPIVTEYSIGRRVWFDDNGDGNEDPGEVGAVGVAYTVTIFDSPDGTPDGSVVRTGVTGLDGLIDEQGLPAGNYTVTVDASNFDPGQVLEGYTSTTGGEVESGVEVGLPVCTDTNVPVGCGLPVHADAIFGYDRGENIGRNSLTTGTCQQYVGGTLAEQNEMEYGLNGNNIGGVTPGGLMFWSTVTVGAGEAVTVVQSRTGAGAGPLLIHGGNQARLLTTNCSVVTGWSATQDPTTGTISFPAVPPGTYVVHVKWFPKSLSGTPKPVPDTIEYTFAVALNGIVVPFTQNDPALSLVKK